MADPRLAGGRRAVMAACGGRTLHFVAHGDGVPVVFVHGFPHDHTLWAAQLGGVADVARAIALDLRGFGASPYLAPATMDGYADDVVCVLDAAGVERAVVAGLSMGGYVAFALWRRHRARVRGLVLADTRAGADTEAGRAARRELIALARERGADAVAGRMMEGMVGRTTRTRAPELVSHLRAMLARQPVDGIVGALEAMLARPDSTPDLPTIDVPTLVVVGDEDVLTPPREARLLHEGIRGSRLEPLAGAGHASAIERPAAFNHVLRDFLAGLPAD
ncbi:MAG TPA: alpha/beta fold hydrolase [Gemmatimonadaceae bacterium]|nr:alpha/beta fold hydrolase [Gemmatimonadaceae bacterium]